MHRLLAGAFALSLVSSAGLAQPCAEPRSTAWVMNRVPVDALANFGDTWVNQFRKWVVAADVDADGADDVILGLSACRQLDCVGSAGAGAPGERRSVVQVFSGRSGEMILEIVSPTPAMIDGQNTVGLFGNNLAAADVDGDGHADIAVAAYGERIDLDGDGTLESSVGVVHVFSGATGDLLYSHPGLTAGDAMGWSLDFVGDWDGDGAPDLLIGRRNSENLAIDLFSGATGTPIHSSVIGGYGYLRISAVGDVTGDGVNDAALTQSNLTNSATRLLYFADATLTPVASYEWPSNSVLLIDPSNIGDVDGDGLADLVFYGGNPLSRSTPVPVVTVMSVVSGETISDFETPDAGWPYVTRVAPLGDVNGDGAPDAAIGPFLIPDDDYPYEVMRVYSLIDGVCLHVWRTRDRSYFADFGGAHGEIAHTYLSMASGDFDGDGQFDVAAVGIPQETFLQPDPEFLRQINIFRRPGCPEDMTGDGFIGFADLSRLLDTFNDIADPGMLPADIDGNGQVDFGDLNLILALFNSGC